MANLDVDGRIYDDTKFIEEYFSRDGLLFKTYQLPDLTEKTDSEVISVMSEQIAALKRQSGYKREDLVELSPTTPNLAMIVKDFAKIHHHVDDEVRLILSGSGKFEIQRAEEPDKYMVISMVPGDLIVIPAYRRHGFHLGGQMEVRCLRLFKDESAWAAIY